MSLINEILEKIRLLLDKPISPLTFNQITQLVNKQVAPNDKILTLFTAKHRADLIIYLLERLPFAQNHLQTLLNFIRKNILQYSNQDVQTIWKLVMQKQQARIGRSHWGMWKVMEEAMRVTNESSKEKLLLLLSSSVVVLRQLKEIETVKAFVKGYCSNYLKYSIYLTPFPALISQCLELDSSTQQLIDASTKMAILQQTLSLLNSTANRLLFPFQNSCLMVLTQILKDPRYIIADSLQLHECNKTLQLYLYKKPTREQARKTQIASQQAQKRMQKQQAGKMQYCYQKKQTIGKQMPLIENVIDRVNKCRQRQHLELRSHSPGVSRTGSSFLKRKQGAGGGRVLLINPNPVPNKSNFNAIDLMVEKCFSQKEQRESNVSRIEEQSIISKNIDQFSQIGHNSSQMSATTSVEEGEDWVQISNLIDLAYQYKFG